MHACMNTRTHIYIHTGYVATPRRHLHFSWYVRRWKVSHCENTTTAGLSAVHIRIATILQFDLGATLSSFLLVVFKSNIIGFIPLSFFFITNQYFLSRITTKARCDTSSNYEKCYSVCACILLRFQSRSIYFASVVAQSQVAGILWQPWEPL